MLQRISFDGLFDSLADSLLVFWVYFLLRQLPLVVTVEGECAFLAALPGLLKAAHGLEHKPLL